MEGAGMEESVTRLPEHSGHLVVVVGHQLGLGRLLRKGKQAMDVLNSLKCLLKLHKSNNVASVISSSSSFY